MLEHKLACVCLCVRAWEIERERERSRPGGRAGQRERDAWGIWLSIVAWQPHTIFPVLSPFFSPPLFLCLSSTSLLSKHCTAASTLPPPCHITHSILPPATPRSHSFPHRGTDAAVDDVTERSEWAARMGEVTQIGGAWKCNKIDCTGWGGWGA